MRITTALSAEVDLEDACYDAGTQAFEQFDVRPHELKLGQKVTLTVFAQDGDNLNGPNTIRGQRYVFKIVSEEALSSILYGKEVNLRRRFEKIIEEVEDTKKDFILHRVRVQEAAQLRGETPQPENALTRGFRAGQLVSGSQRDQRVTRVRSPVAKLDQAESLLVILLGRHRFAGLLFLESFGSFGSGVQDERDLVLLVTLLLRLFHHLPGGRVGLLRRGDVHRCARDVLPKYLAT